MSKTTQERQRRVVCDQVPKPFQITYMTTKQKPWHTTPEPLRTILLDPLVELDLWSNESGLPSPFVHNDPIVSSDLTVEVRKIRLRVYRNQLAKHFTPSVQKSLEDVIEHGGFSSTFEDNYRSMANKVALRLGCYLEAPNKELPAWKWVVNDQFISITVYVKRVK